MKYFDEIESQLVRATGGRRPLRSRLGAPLWEAALVGGAAAVVVAVVAVAVLAGGGGRTEPGGGAGGASGRIDSALVANLRILRRPVRPDDLIPKVFLGPSPVSARRPRWISALAPELARRQAIPGLQLEAWVEPGRYGLCMYGAQRLRDGSLSPPGGFGAQCDPSAAVVRGVGIVHWIAGRPLAIGLVPDRVSEVLLAMRSGSARHVSVSDGIFAAHVVAGERLYAVIAGRRILLGARPPAVQAPPRLFPGEGGRPVAQINLVPAGPVRHGSPGGVAQVVANGAKRGIVIVATRVPPNHRSNAYAVWLYSNPQHALMLGFVNPGVGHNGRLSTAGALPADAAGYRQILITLETRSQPLRPGRVILEGLLTLG